MEDFILGLLDLLFFPFRSDSLFFVVIAGVFLFCFSFSLIRKIMRFFL